MQLTGSAKELDEISDSICDIYFLDRDLALITSLENNCITTPQGEHRLQICYYDGLPFDDAPINLINVPNGAFTSFFGCTSLPLPRNIVCLPDTDRHTSVEINSVFQQMIAEIRLSRQRRIDQNNGYPVHKDSYYLDPRIAYQTALQQNRVFIQHPTKTGLQVCYYDGAPIEGGPENLINVPVEDLLDFLSNCRTRLPTELIYPANTSLEEVQAGTTAFNELVEQAKQNRSNVSKELAIRISQQKPQFNSEDPMRVFFIADHRTQVMQYVSINLAKAFEKLGHQVLISMEENDMEALDFPWHFKAYLEFNPHIVVNINHQNNAWLNEDVFNVIWYQDPVSEIKNCNPLHWRDRDLIYSISSEYDEYLRKCGAPSVKRQIICIDETVFNTNYPVKRENKIVFIGSSYINNIYKGTNSSPIIEELKHSFEVGDYIDRNLCNHIAARHNVAINDIWPYTAAYVVRDFVVEWLCEIPKFDIEIYGRYWENNPVVRPYFKGELNHGRDVANIYNSAKYALSATVLTINSQRLTELAGCGCIPVVYDTREKADKPHWNNECLFFKTPGELQTLLDKSPAGDAKKIADKYKYSTFAKELLEEIHRRLN